MRPAEIDTVATVGGDRHAEPEYAAELDKFYRADWHAYGAMIVQYRNGRDLETSVWRELISRMADRRCKTHDQVLDPTHTSGSTTTVEWS